MKILLISGLRIFPCNTGGHVHSSGILRSLARMGHRVTAYSLAGRGGDYGLGSVFGASFRIDDIETDLVEETNLSLLFGFLQGIVRRLDYPRVWQYALLHRALVPRRMKRALQDADIVLSDMPWCPPVPGPWSKKPWFLISHNLEHRLLEQANPRHRRFAGWMRKIEQDAPLRYRDIFPCAESDRDFYRANDTAGTLRLPMIRCGVDPKDYAVAHGTRERVRTQLGVGEAEHLILFSGSNHTPNLEALEVLKAFSRRHADFLAREGVKVLLLGSMAPAGFREGALIATGRVPEVASYFAAADAGLNPITRGSGANVKLFEYLATRLPVISTVFGVRGTDLKPGIDYLPYEGDGLLGALETLIRTRTRAQWRAFAADVWLRHRSSCDIGELVKDATALRPEFSGRPPPRSNGAT